MLNNNLSLREETMEILNNMVKEEYPMETVINDILNNGCVNGIVGDLMYYYQTEAFFDRHKQEINDMAQEMSEEIYGNKYDIYKNLRFECSKNTMAWFGFEEMTRIIAEELEIEY